MKIYIIGQRLNFRSLTIFAPVTNYCEKICVNAKSSAHVPLQFANAWISWYPRPIEGVFAQGGEIFGQPFINVPLRHHIHPHPTTVTNPQANAICERLHQTSTHALSPDSLVVLLLRTARGLP
jgi:hypothetical protein